MANFTSIIAHEGSQQNSFEELICQVVRRTEAKGAGSWRRIHGAGGDGGVEAYWSPSTGKKTGIQAKYFLRSADIKWTQVEASFATALNIHSDLTDYRIYLACDLTGTTGRPGRTGVEAWESARARMIAKAAAADRHVEIHLRTASDVSSDLARPECAGLRGYWLGDLEISDAGIRGWLKSAQQALGDRYHPEDNVEVAAQSVLRALGRSPLVRKELLDQVEEVLSCERLRLPKAWANATDKQETLSEISASVDGLEELRRAVDPSIAGPWPVDTWASDIDRLADQTDAVFRASFDGDLKDLDIQSFREKARTLNAQVGNLLRCVQSETMESEQSRCVVLVGSAGSGKSHLLASACEELVENGGMAVLFLGHRLLSLPIWRQMAEQLGYASANRDELLGALDAAAAAKRTRAIIAIDALNEGPLRHIWLKELEPFINDVLAFENLAVAVSCRDVFRDQIIPERIRSTFPIVDVLGFTTDAERERAAEVYMDRRGIARPAAPWLAPEFVNPLFLRSCSIALKNAGQTKFPTGLHGTKQILAFYVDSVSRGLDTEWDGATNLSAPCKRALNSIALAMAKTRQDWLGRSEAARAVDHEFAGFTPPHGLTWTDVLVRNGVLREDPHPSAVVADPLQAQNDVLRFSFQRFQDHLMADALLKTAADDSELFCKSGKLEFILSPRGHISWEWDGLVEALSIQIPEKFGRELVDVLPGGERKHWQNHTIQHSFSESIKWRDPSAISDRSLALANKLGGASGIWWLLFELCARHDHPWNSDLIHSNLARLRLPERDRRWTMYVSSEGGYDEHPLQRLIQWSATGHKVAADPEVLRLCAQTLCWTLSTTSRSIRDRATKGLSALFADKPDLFPTLLAKFAQIDDLYILERLVGAAYGALLRNPLSKTAEAYADAIFTHIFAEGPPADLLLRDYASGIVVVAKRIGALRENFEISKCLPPFSSKRPSLTVSEKRVLDLVEKAGDDQIWRSCDQWGDFQRYELDTTLRKISRTPLSSPAPYTSGQLAAKFERELEEADRNLRKDLSRLRNLYWTVNSPSTRLAHLIGKEPPPDPSAVQLEELEALEKRLLSAFTPQQQKDFKNVWLPARLNIGQRKGRSRNPNPDALAAGRWIAARAYSMGWTKARFGKDLQSYGSHSRDRPGVERIGKKYQWLARSELLCRLVDNYWLAGEFDDQGPAAYENATDLGFERDIDPSLFRAPGQLDADAVGDSRGMLPAPIEITPLDGDDRLKWPFADDRSEDAAAKVRFVDGQGESWVRLSWHSWCDRYRHGRRGRIGHDLAQREFFYVIGVLCERGSAAEIAKAVEKKQSIDLSHWDGPEYIDHPFLFEVGLRNTWPSKRWWSEYFEEDSVRFSPPVDEYRWEGHLDGSLPEGASAHVLAGWITEAENLRLSAQTPQMMCDEGGGLVAWSTSGKRKNSGLCVKEKWFDEFLGRHKLECMFIVLGEREAWNDGDQFGARAYRRFHRLLVPTVAGEVQLMWNIDTKNGGD